MNLCYYVKGTGDGPTAKRFCPLTKTTAPPPLGWSRAVALALVWILGPPSAKVSGAVTVQSPLALVARGLTQDQGAWIVDYRLRNTGGTGVIVLPEELGVGIEGWVSNSRVTSHTVPRWSSILVSPSVDPTAVSEVITVVDESHRCRERMTVSTWAEDQPQTTSSRHSQREATVRIATALVSGTAVESLVPLSLSPGDAMHVRLRIEHQHILYGDYDPLLGVRTVALKLGKSIVRDLVPLDREQYLAQPKYTWPEPPEDRRDTRHFVSGPDSLHLEADVLGHQSYRYQERPVRYGTKMRLRFWYLIAVGTEGECRVRVAQNKDTPITWRQLHEAEFEERLKTIGRWTKFNRIVQTEPEATRLILEFKIVGEIDVGEMWIDDVSIEPVGNAMPAGP